MSPKAFAQVSVFILILMAFLAIPGGVLAGGVCGGTWVVDQGETVDSIAARCGTTASAIYAANPGIGGTVYPGQVLTLPGGGSNIPYTPVPVYTPVSNYNTYYNSYNYYNYVPASYSGMYIVQYGDTFSGIASRFGVGIYDLWAANPQIWNINYIYTGQAIYVPTMAGQVYYPPQYTGVSTPTAEPVPLSYGTVPEGAPYGRIKLSNKANADVYVSLQGTTRDGFDVINEYPVSGSMNVSVPAAWYNYVAWVGGKKFQGGFHLGGDSNHTITFFSNKVVVD